MIVAGEALAACPGESICACSGLTVGSGKRRYIFGRSASE